MTMPEKREAGPEGSNPVATSFFGINEDRGSGAGKPAI